MTSEAKQATWWDVPGTDPVKERTGVPAVEVVKFLQAGMSARGFYPQAQVGQLLGLSRQRVGQLVDAGKLTTQTWLGVRMVEGRSLVDFMEERGQLSRAMIAKLCGLR